VDIDEIRKRAQRAIAPLKAADASTSAPENFLFAAKRTEAGRSLPDYYLVYFLLVDLLGFRNLGQFEKIAWSVPVEFDGRAFLIEHRKFGVGVFAASLPEDELAASQIVVRIHKAVKAARPYFDWRAQLAASDSKLNVVNRSRELFARLEFYLGLYDARRAEAEARADEVIKTPTQHGSIITQPALNLRREARWFALSGIECFFSWTEHVFIHIAILSGRCATGGDVARLARSEWSDKYKAALDLNDAQDKRFYDELAIMRRQLRNFVAHGAFGKDGEAFRFHSTAGTVPMLLPHNREHSSFRFGQGVNPKSDEAIDLIRAFTVHLWSGPRAAAKIYVQDYALPLILTNVANGACGRAMLSEEAMTEHADHLGRMMDRHANMDF